MAYSVSAFDHDLGDVVRRAWRHYGARPYDVESNAPHTVPDLYRCAGERMGRLRIWFGGTASAIYADPAVNLRFRAWHDNCHLANSQLGFTAESEILLGEWQRSLACSFGDLFARIVHCEIAGQAEFFALTGRFLVDQRSFTLDYLNRVEWREQLENY